MPALRSYWLQIHVTLAAASEGAFAVGFVSSILYLIKSRLSESSRIASRLPDLTRLDIITYRSIAVGYPMFTVGALFAGAIWAHQAWGSFWSWDPQGNMLPRRVDHLFRLSSCSNYSRITRPDTTLFKHSWFCSSFVDLLFEYIPGWAAFVYVIGIYPYQHSW